MILTDESQMPFGKYKDVEMQNVPAGYLLDFLIVGFAGRAKVGEREAITAYIESNSEVINKMYILEQEQHQEEQPEDMDVDIDFDIFEQE